LSHAQFKYDRQLQKLKSVNRIFLDLIKTKVQQFINPKKLTDPFEMEYQKRLRFIDYVKKNFTVSDNEMIVFHFDNYEDTHLITAQKVTAQATYPEYVNLRRQLNLGECLLIFCHDGPYLDFQDDYLNYEEVLDQGVCVRNSLNVSIKRSKKEIKEDIEGLLRELNGEEPIYCKSDC
jgi:hypothetical protein